MGSTRWSFLTNPAFYAAAGVLFAAAGVEAPAGLFRHIGEAAASLSAIVAMIGAWRDG